MEKKNIHLGGKFCHDKRELVTCAVVRETWAKTRPVNLYKNNGKHNRGGVVLGGRRDEPRQKDPKVMNVHRTT